jgi:hypothetical protein
MKVDQLYINFIMDEITRTYGIKPNTLMSPHERRDMRDAAFMYLMGPIIHPCTQDPPKPK